MSSEGLPHTSSTPGATNQGRVRYVETQPQMGWQGVTQSVREVDEEKVQNCKEDIDTLLVFAGLYSAVLSAFLVESYTSLLPDTDSQTIYLLQRIADQTQSYTFAGGNLNTTAAPRDPPAGDVPLWAVTVNALWFASLIVSLSVASFGMLVKQWLREYFAMEWTAPRERLHVRHLRRPALDRWRVFEIAAALPILLQAALGLFFAGLCTFTIHVDARVARTTVPLVCAWAAFFVFTTLAPLATPRCPYKTPFLNGALTALRNHFMRPLLHAVNILGCCVCLRGPEDDPSEDELTMEEEEEALISHDSDDYLILFFTDKYMLDDNLLPALLDVYNQSTLITPENMVSFVVQLVNNRLSLKSLSTPLHASPDLTDLSKSAYKALLDFVGDYVMSFPVPFSLSRGGWAADAWLILTSKSKTTFPDHAAEARRRILCTDPVVANTLVLENGYHLLDEAWSYLGASVALIDESVRVPRGGSAQVELLAWLNQRFTADMAGFWFAGTGDPAKYKLQVQLIKDGWKAQHASAVFLRASCVSRS